MRAQSIPATFWSRVTRGAADECWPWAAGRDPHGYGLMWWHGRTLRAHRLAWALANDQAVPPPEVLVCHRGDNPSCVNPAHLWLGSNLDNTRDRTAKGRGSNGNERKTHCTEGHEYTPENTYSYRGWRQCRACNRAAVAAYKSRKVSA